MDIGVLLLNPAGADEAWEEYMATVSESRTTDRAISDVEFEALLQKTYEMVQAQKPLEPSAESTSWT